MAVGAMEPQGMRARAGDVNPQPNGDRKWTGRAIARRRRGAPRPNDIAPLWHHCHSVSEIGIQ